MGWIRMTDYMCMKGCNRGIRENEIVLTAEGSRHRHNHGKDEDGQNQCFIFAFLLSPIKGK